MSDKVDKNMMSLEAITKTCDDKEVRVIIIFPKDALPKGDESDEVALKTIRKYFETSVHRFVGLVAAILDGEQMASHWVKMLDDGLIDIAKNMKKAVISPGEKDTGELN